MATTSTALSPVPSYADFVLPATVVSRVDLSRLVSEVEWIDNELTSLAIRNPSAAVTMPVLSAGLSDLTTQNHLELSDSKTRTAIVAQLRLLKAKAPILHMTFAVSADRDSLEQLAAWLRREIHPHALIVAGLQPALVAGVYLRTPNHVRDYSLRAMLDGRHDVLIKELESLRASK